MCVARICINALLHCIAVFSAALSSRMHARGISAFRSGRRGTSTKKDRVFNLGGDRGHHPLQIRDKTQDTRYGKL